jgi:hypothetical protein
LQGDAGVVINSATSVGVKIDAATAGNVEINSAAGTILIGNDAVNGAINIGTGGVRTVTVGNTAATELQLDAILLDVNAAGLLTLDGVTGINIGDQADVPVDIDASTLVIDAATSALLTSPIVSIDASNYVEIKAGSNAAELRFYEATADGYGLGPTPNFIAFQAGDVGLSDADPEGDDDANFTFTWPTNYGAPGQILKSNGSGVLSWVTDATSASSVTNTNVFGDPADGQDVVFTFDSYEVNGVLTWMEDEDYFKFDNDVYMNGDKKVQFGSTGDYISLTSPNLTMVAAADMITTAGDEFKVDAVTDITLDADGEDIFFVHNADIFASATKASATNDLIIKSGTTAAMEFLGAIAEVKSDLIVAGNDIKSGTLGSPTTAITLSGANVTVAGDLTVTGNDLDFGNGATIVNTNGTVLTITEATTALSGDLTVTGDDITMGTNTAGFVMVADGTNFNPVAISGDVAITSAGVATVTGSTTNAALTAGVGISAAGTFDGSTARTLALDLNQLTAEVIATGDHLAFNDAGDNGQHKETIDDLFAIGPALVTEDAIANGDYILFLDGGSTGEANKEAIADVATLFAGAGLTASAGALAVDAAQTQITSVGTIGTGTWEGTAIAQTYIAADAIDGTKVADDAIDSEHYTDASIDFAHIQNVAANSILARAANSSGVLSEVALATTEILIGNGTGFTAAALSGDATMTNGGVVNIAADAITAAEIADDAISGEHLDPTVISDYATETAVAGDYILILDADGSVLKKANFSDFRPAAPPTPTSSSDMRFKKNISTVSGALEKLSKLNPVNYDWRNDEFKNKGFNDKKQWGFIAQEVEKVMPELVGADDDDYLTLNYNGFVPLLTKAMQEQQTEIENQQKEIDELKTQLELIMKMMQSDMSDKTDHKKAENNEKPVKLSMATIK